MRAKPRVALPLALPPAFAARRLRLALGFDTRLGRRGGRLTGPRYRLEHPLSLVMRRLGSLLHGRLLGPGLAPSTVLPSVAILLRLGARFGGRPLARGAPWLLAGAATPAATAASPPRTLACLGAALVLLVGAPEILAGPFACAFLAFILVVMLTRLRLGMSVRMGMGKRLALGAALGTTPPAPSAP